MWQTLRIPKDQRKNPYRTYDCTESIATSFPDVKNSPCFEYSEKEKKSRKYKKVFVDSLGNF